MASNTQQLLLARRKGENTGLIDRGIRKRIVSKNRRKDGSESITQEDMERIARDYIDEDYLDGIYNKETAEDAAKSIESDDNLSNFVAGAKDKFTTFLFNKYSVDIADRIMKNNVQLKNKIVRGTKVGKDIYLTATKIQGRTLIQAKSIKTGRIVGVKKSYIKKV